MTKRKDDKDTQAKTHDPQPAADAGPASAAGSAGEALPVDVGPKPEGAPADPGAPAADGSPAPTPEQIELERLRDRLLRLQADFDNYRKRTQRERDEIQKRAGEAVLADLIPVLDQLDFGIQQAADKPEWKSVAEGLRLIWTELRETLRKHGLADVEALGREFDPREHEAIAHMPSAEAPDGTIVAQTRKGYRLGDRLLRAAMVVVSSGPGPEIGTVENEADPDEGED